MADEANTGNQSSDAAAANRYTVVARRYRPKTFEELVGQDTVAQGLLRAIETNRVGHAYLFTGARGVGKTSTARIFAKALNASTDGTGRFDPSSEVALAIDAGDDMDVIEIDGASNRGIDEIRQLRSNASIRPTRSAYKIYIIDEVHMLTTQAFNALLKTLEEPPGHVKFIFCTTDPEKIPITVLSRCQRYDFPPVSSNQILDRLKFICQNEGTEADEEALKVIARRAAGSMRDSQSLLEQMLSFGGKHISVAEVHAMMGTADETRMAAFAQCMVERDAARAMTELNEAITDGVDPGQLAEQFLGFLRDVMTISIGAPADLLRTADISRAEELKRIGSAWGLTTLLSAIQLLDETIVKMKHSVQSRILLEVALVQICTLADLQAISDVVQGLAQNLNPNTLPVRTQIAPISAPVANSKSSEVDLKKKDTLTPDLDPEPKTDPNKAELGTREMDQKPTASSAKQEGSIVVEHVGQSVDSEQQIVSEELLEEPQGPLAQLSKVALGLGGLVRQLATLALDVVELDGDCWEIHLAKESQLALPTFSNAESTRKLSEGLKQLVGRDLSFKFILTDRSMPQMAQSKVAEDNLQPKASQPQRIRETMADPLIKRFIEVLGVEVTKVDDF